MKTRIITAIVALAIFIPILWFSNTWIFPFAMALCAVIGCCEMLFSIGLKKNWFLIIPISAAAVFFPFFMRYNYLMQQKSMSYTMPDVFKLSIGIALIFALYVFAVAVFGNKKLAVTDASLAYMGCLYIIYGFSAIVYIHDYIHLGNYIYLLTFICAWLTDIFAYFTGRLFGKRKLIPAVSPKKTVEGAIGGVVFCVLGLLAFGLIVEKVFNPQGTTDANYIVLAISGVFISVVSQIGDLIMSVIKRHFGIKDYGKLFPGHGGILDRFDSVIAVAVILAFICTYFNLFAPIVA